MGKTVFREQKLFLNWTEIAVFIIPWVLLLRAMSVGSAEVCCIIFKIMRSAKV